MQKTAPVEFPTQLKRTVSIVSIEEITATPKNYEEQNGVKFRVSDHVLPHVTKLHNF